MAQIHITTALEIAQNFRGNAEDDFRAIASIRDENARLSPDMPDYDRAASKLGHALTGLQRRNQHSAAYIERLDATIDEFNNRLKENKLALRNLKWWHELDMTERKLTAEFTVAAFGDAVGSRMGTPGMKISAAFEHNGQPVVHPAHTGISSPEVFSAEGRYDRKHGHGTIVFNTHKTSNFSAPYAMLTNTVREGIAIVNARLAHQHIKDRRDALYNDAGLWYHATREDAFLRKSDSGYGQQFHCVAMDDAVRKAQRDAIQDICISVPYPEMDRPRRTFWGSIRSGDRLKPA